LSVSGNNDGTINYSIRKITKQAPTGEYNVGSLSKTVILNVGKNLATLADPTTPVARGILKTLDVRHDDAGGITYIMRTATRVEQTLVEDAVGGSLLHGVSKTFKVGDITQDDLDANAEVIEGTTIQWNVQLDEDGSANTVKVTTVADEYLSGALTISNLLPQYNKDGYKDSSVVFENVAKADLDTYFKFTGAVYGYVDSIRVHEDGTMSGKSITRTYNNTTTWVILGSPTTATYDVIEELRHTGSHAGGAKHLFTIEVPWTYSHLVTSTWGAAVNHVDGGDRPGTSITKVTFGGIE